MLPTIERIHPHSVDAERAVLGAIILNNEVLTHITLRPDQFYRTGHQAIFTAMQRLDLSNMPIDIITIMGELKKANELERAGGGAYIATLTNEVPTVAHAEHHAKEIARLAALSSLITNCNQIAAEAYDVGSDVEELSNRYIDSMDSGAIGMKGYSVKEVMSKTFGALEAAMEGKGPQVIETGLTELDKMVAIKAPKFTVIAGRPGMGKTSIAMKIARSAAKSVPVAIYTIEMDVEEIGEVFIAQETSVSRKRMAHKDLSQKDFGNMGGACQKHIDHLHYRVFDDGAMTPAMIRKSAKLMKKREGLGLIIIDYLSLMEAGVKTNQREEAVAYISRSLKRLAKELMVPVVALQQLNRQCEGRPDKRPNLGDLRESGAIEQDADTVILAYRPEYYWPCDEDGISREEGEKRKKFKNILELIIPKQRGGETGSVKVQWDGAATNVRNLDRWNT